MRSQARPQPAARATGSQFSASMRMSVRMSATTPMKQPVHAQPWVMSKPPYSRDEVADAGAREPRRARDRIQRRLDGCRQIHPEKEKQAPDRLGAPVRQARTGVGRVESGGGRRRGGAAADVGELGARDVSRYLRVVARQSRCRLTDGVVAAWRVHGSSLVLELCFEMEAPISKGRRTSANVRRRGGHIARCRGAASYKAARDLIRFPMRAGDRPARRRPRRCSGPATP